MKRHLHQRKEEQFTEEEIRRVEEENGTEINQNGKKLFVFANVRHDSRNYATTELDGSSQWGSDDKKFTLTFVTARHVSFSSRLFVLFVGLIILAAVWLIESATTVSPGACRSAKLSNVLMISLWGLFWISEKEKDKWTSFFNDSDTDLTYDIQHRMLILTEAICQSHFSD